MNYLEALYAPANGEGFLSVWNKANKATEWFPATSDGLATAAERMRVLGQQCDTYFGWCLQGQPSAIGRGSSETAIFSPGIMFDADLKSNQAGVHSQEALPETLDEVLSWINEASIPDPTHIRSSGNGLYLDWLHSESVFFRDTEDRKKYAALASNFHRKLIASALQLRGWKFDFTADLARITRMPGTSNHKTSPAKPVELVR